MSEPTYLVMASDAALGGSFHACVAEGNDLAETVTQALEQGYTEGRIYNQYNNASADLAEWVEDNQGRLGAYRLQMAEMEDAEWN